MNETTCEIPLTHGWVALVDAADYDAVVAAGKWHPKPGRSRDVYVQRNLKRGGIWTTQTLHAFLTGWPRVDHINGYGLDNRRCNLRPATQRQNMQNMHRPIGSSGYKGVSWHAQTGKWIARITVNGKTMGLGYFSDLELAAHAYDAAALEHFGAYARPNFTKENQDGGANHH